VCGGESDHRSYTVRPVDPVTYLGVIALLAGVSVITCGVPA